MIDLQRFRPTRATWTALLGLLSALFVSAVREFIWADLRKGRVRFRELPLGARYLAWLGFVLLFAIVGMLLFNDVVRATASLLPLSAVPPGRGIAVPILLVPTTLFVLSIACSYMLTGALHAHWI